MSTSAFQHWNSSQLPIYPTALPGSVDVLPNEVESEKVIVPNPIPAFIPVSLDQEVVYKRQGVKKLRLILGTLISLALFSLVAAAVIWLVVVDPFSPFPHPRREVRISGKVVGVDGKLLPNTIITVHCTTPDVDVFHELYTDNEGSYMTPILNFGNHYLVTAEPNSNTYASERLLVLDGKPQIVDFELGYKPAVVEGKVVNGFSGLSLILVPIRLSCPSVTRTTSSDFSGNYHITGVPREQCELVIQLSGYLDYFRMLEIDNYRITHTAKPYPIDTSPSLTVRTVNDANGNTLSNTKVTLSGFQFTVSTQTNSKGEAELVNVKNGVTYSVKAERSWYKTVTRSVTVNGPTVLTIRMTSCIIC
ncbi:hypothetical protein RCL1_005303 [Eukaryota sp. TZLM3-RCL]